MKEAELKENNFYTVKKKYLAEALSYLGFRYYKYIQEDNKVSYVFEKTIYFEKCLSELIHLKARCGNNHTDFKSD